MQTVLLVGFPNSGKSTIFNMLSGQMRKIANYSGVTVDEARAEFKSNQLFQEKIQIVDLPGLYNIAPNSLDEAIAIKTILLESKNYHLAAAVLDMERLEASLSLALALKDILGEKLFLIVNKDDQGHFGKQGQKKLEKLTNLKVLSISAKYQNERELDRFIRENIKQKPIEILKGPRISKKSLDYFDPKEQEQIKEVIETTTSGEALKDLKNYHLKARAILKKAFKMDKKTISLTEKIDQFFLHPISGSFVFIAIFYFLFLSIYKWSGPAMDFIDQQITLFGTWSSLQLPPGLINSLVVDGAIAGVGSVVIFLPQIMILFFLLSLLEQSGYISRAAVLTDKLMSFFGLNGKAFLPYLSGFACSIPGIMAARTIPDKKERLVTILTIPLITCAARLPVYILLVGTFVPDKDFFGIFNARALSFFFLYFLGSLFALIIAKVFRLSYFKGKSSSFFIDLPHYQRPSLRLAIKQSLSRGKVFLKKAGTIILALSILIWAASSFPRPENMNLNQMSEAEVSAYTLQNSYLGSLGKVIEPIIKPLGMDWKIGVGLLAAFGARELFVATMGTIYALGDVDEKSNSLTERLLSEKDPLTGKPVFNFAVAWSILIFFVFAMQCIGTLAVLKRETGGWPIPVMAMSYMGLLAYLGAFITYRFLSYSLI